MNANKLIKKTIKNKKGKLFLFEKIFVNFNLKRFFIINSEKKLIRGEHGHKGTNQIFLPLNNEVEIEIYRKNFQKKFKLKLNEALLVPKKNWVRIKFKNYKSQLLIMSDKKFSKYDYFYEKN